ncbi:MAG: hypothetical protein HS110_12040 [Zoogloeaceae bacterium]|nr:hypothetical protein [Zoogloeaceae bacterium]
MTNLLAWNKIVKRQLLWSNAISSDDLRMYESLKATGASIADALSRELANASTLYNKIQRDQAAWLQRRKDSYYSVLADVYSGKAPRNFRRELAASEKQFKVYLSFSKRHRFGADGQAEQLFDDSLVLRKADLTLTQLCIGLGCRNVDGYVWMEPSSIQPTDFQLCLAWANRTSNASDNIDFDKLKQLLGTYNAVRLVSARIAEKACIRYYNRLAPALPIDDEKDDYPDFVTDVSIQQIDRNASSNWKDFDLLVDKQPVDVKNARASFSNPSAYVEHCIPRFKLDRVSQQHVDVAGVFSNYLNATEITTAPSECLILGRTSLPYARSLYRWMTARFGAAINFRGLWKPGYFPNWIFEYPDTHYAKQNQVIANIDEMLTKLLAMDRDDLRIPPWLFSLSTQSDLLTKCLTEAERRTLSDLHALRAALGYTRPSLYLYVLGTALTGLLERRSFEEVFGTVLPAIFVPVGQDERISPLGLDDPQAILEHLMDNLAAVFNHVLLSSLHFVAFQMSHPMILRGQLEDGSWITVLAYCGGRARGLGLVKCGASPLVLGEHKVCQSCGHLICNKCGYCAEGCRELDTRRIDQLDKADDEGFDEY